MMFVRLTAAIAFATFLAIACLASLVAALLAPVLARRLPAQSSARRAASLFGLRTLPVAIAVFTAFAVVLPLFMWFEPADTREALATTIAIMAIGGGLLMGAMVWRAAVALRATFALTRRWRSRRPLQGLDMALPVFAIDEPYPLVAVIGFLRPELYISQTVLRACSRSEVRAMLMHECAHVTARDNLKRLLLRACPSLVPGARALDAEWAHAVEETADAQAAGSRAGAALDLAQALVTVARLVTATHPPLPVSAFYLGGAIDSRVRRLLEERHTPQISGISATPLLTAAACLAVATAMAFGPAIHAALEAAVAWLP